MATQASLDQIQNLYIAFYGRPADAAGQEYWADELEAANGDLSAIINAFASSEEYQRNYGDLEAADLVNALYQQILGRDAEQAGLDFYVEELAEGNITEGEIALAILNGAQGEDAAVLESRKDVADAFTASVAANNKEYGEEQEAAAKAMLAGVDADTEVADVDIDGIVLGFPDAEDNGNGGGEVGETFRLAADQDVLTGTENDDTFVGYILDNQNTLQSGDIIDGGAGTDKLVAEIGDSQAFAIAAKTKNVEEVFIRAQDTAIEDASDNPTPDFVDSEVQIDAQDMVGVKEWWSVDSRADLVIEDIRLSGSEITDFDQLLGEGAAENSLPSDVTFGMKSTDAAVSFGAYFDSQSLIAAPDEATNSQLRVNLMDLGTEEIPHDPNQPLGQLNIEGFNFILNGVQYTLKSDGIYNAKTYEELETAVRAALNEAKADNPELAGLSINRVEDGFETNAYVNGTSQGLVQGDSILLNDANGGTFEGAGFVAREDGVTDFTLYGRQRPEDPSIASNMIETNIALDNVGRGSMGGDLQVGGMSNTPDSGIEVFNVFVDRDSKLSSMSSTNNQLKVVNVESVGAEGDLVIAQLDNVQDVNAASFKGDLSITGEIEELVIDRDLNLVDEQDNPAADNSNFDYTFGAGNDSLNLLLDGNVAAHEDFALNINMGNGNNSVVTEINFAGNDYQDQSDLDNISVTTGTGNDTVNTYGEGDVTISTGAGNDTVYADNSGSSDDAYFLGFADTVTTIDTTVAGGPEALEAFIADQTALLEQLGLTNVVISVDDSAPAAVVIDGVTADGGVHGTWAFNSQNLEVSDLLGGDGSLNSGGLDSSTNPAFLWGASLTVTISGATLAGAGLTEEAAAAFDNGWESTVEVPTGDNYVADERHINQAIKEAINSDEVLNKLLRVVDGENNTLIVQSLVDGTFSADDLIVELNVGDLAGLSATELAGVQDAWEAFNGNSAAAAIAAGDLDAGVAALVGNHEGLSNGSVVANNSQLAQNGGVDITGTDSAVESDNIINAGSGNDVVVLGTGTDSNDTVVFTNYNNGENTIVNFVAGDSLGEDYLDFSAYLNNMTSASGSVESQQLIAQTLNADATLEANSVTIFEAFNSAAVANETWEALTASDLLAAIVDGNGQGYGNILDATFDAEGTIANYVGSERSHIVMIENDANDGEYKVFELSSDNTSAEFTSVQLIGTYDFGDSLGGVLTLADNLA
ncbi:DUF4214 domain-containing protein [Marinobacterium stanieri]|uniref:DUF4214 domain-containing protein n=1 Tax=Marinobacterium stanieri TaxID=49186 RepID=A0A1N6WCF1_9GAMM|nr:DUF4214 domain-containing protein [Marinobacterium stanieri]SIQ87817.1 protein of unknown function [Marinobacterium stanieri]